MDDTTLAKLAVPAVVLLVAFLSYSSQLLFYGIEPGLLDKRESLTFNILVVCIWVSYARACITNPGRVPTDWHPKEAERTGPASPAQSIIARQRYCRKCEAVKPPRSHHCRVCRRYGVPRSHPSRADVLQLHPKNGSSLSLDSKLCLPFYFSALHALPVLCYYCNVLP